MEGYTSVLGLGENNTVKMTIFAPKESTDSVQSLIKLPMAFSYRIRAKILQSNET